MALVSVVVSLSAGADGSGTFWAAVGVGGNVPL